jgi:hypothetical protein
MGYRTQRARVYSSVTGDGNPIRQGRVGIDVLGNVSNEKQRNKRSRQDRDDKMIGRSPDTNNRAGSKESDQKGHPGFF